jgi:hypothetical protein
MIHQGRASQDSGSHQDAGWRTHKKDIREYETTSIGLKVGKRLEEYQGLTTGIPVPLNPGGRGKELPRKQGNKNRK